MTVELSAQTTVVVPVWDEYVAELISQALPSLLAQEAHARVVVIDNASAVDVPEVPGATVVRSPRRLKLGSARNLGLDQVQTPYVMFWDADDIMLPGTLAYLEAELTEDPGLVAFGAAIMEGASGTRHRWPRGWIAKLIPRRGLFALVMTVWSIYPSTGATLIRTDVARAAGGFSDADSGDDWCLAVSLAFGGRLGWSERPGRVYRLHEGSIWTRYMAADNQVRHARIVRERIRKDPAVSSRVRLALPIIALAQWAAIGGHLVVSATRRQRWILRA